MVPVPAFWVKLAAVTAPVKVVLAPLVTVRAPSRGVPTGPVIEIFPVPATRVSPSVEAVVGFTVLDRVISPAKAPVDSWMLAPRVRAVAKLKFALVVVMLAPTRFTPAPFWVKVPVVVIVPVVSLVNNPPLVISVRPPVFRELFTVRMFPV